MLLNISEIELSTQKCTFLCVLKGNAAMFYLTSFFFQVPAGPCLTWYAGETGSIKKKVTQAIKI